MTTIIDAPAITLDETEAAAHEALAPMPADLIALRAEKLLLDQQIDALKERKDAIRDIFGKRLEDLGLQGFVLNGKVHARRSEVHTGRLDGEALKKRHPKLYAQFLKFTDSIRVTIN
jgi:hypothetical protein